MSTRHKRITMGDNCMGCLACEVACKQEHNLPVGPRWIRVFPDMREVGGQLRFNYLVTECVHAAPGPCQVACPAEMNAWRYTTLISQGKFPRALEVIRETTPFAGILGLVCTRPCESSCERGDIDAPVGIRSLKHFVADYEMRAGRKKATPVNKTKDSKVAIIGSGPAGLSCAYDLIRQGYPVTVFEAESQPGGHLRYAIPEFRLPRDMVDNEISLIEELGVVIKTNTPVRNLEEIFNQKYKAIFLATGAHLSHKMEIPGEEAVGVMRALDFLKQLNSGKKIVPGERVAVIGGGNTAVDAARVSKRLGAKEVSIIYRRSRAEMPAMATEVEEAEREGIKMNFLAAPISIMSKDNRLTGIQCIRMELGHLDESGRRSPVPVNGSGFDLDLDTLLVAVGESVDRATLPIELECTHLGTLYVNPHTFQTDIAGVFAGGDVVTGPSDVIRAITAGKGAAVSIDRYLKGKAFSDHNPFSLKAFQTSKDGNTKKRVIPSIVDEKVAMTEASRCFNCGVCGEMIEKRFQTACVSACPSHCIYFRDTWEMTPKTGIYRVD